jgi:hypothetical protein
VLGGFGGPHDGDSFALHGEIFFILLGGEGRKKKQKPNE